MPIVPALRAATSPEVWTCCARWCAVMPRGLWRGLATSELVRTTMLR